MWGRAGWGSAGLLLGIATERGAATRVEDTHAEPGRVEAAASTWPLTRVLSFC